MQTVAKAKINLGLQILGRRPDDFHDIRTTLAEISVPADILEFDLLATGEIQLSVTGSDFHLPPEQNLVYLAAKRLQRLQIEPVGVRIHLHKNIPSGAGLGGGSSDSAAALRSLSELWQLGLSSAELEKIAAELGSDTPFFVRGGVQCATGRGEILTRAIWPEDLPRRVVLVCPPIQISSAWAYAAWSQAELRESAPRTAITNDFEQIVFAEHPMLHNLKSELTKLGGLASLSGSGAAVFGLFDTLPDQHALLLLERYGRVFVAEVGF